MTKAQTTYTYYTGTSTAYLNASHWIVGGVQSTKFPGVDNNSSSTADGTASDIAAFGAIGFTTSFGFGINFNTSSATGVTANSGANGKLTVGAIDFLSTLGSGFQFGNSSTTLAGLLTLGGGSLNGIANTVISNEGSSSITFAPQTSGTSTVMPMTIGLGNANANVIQINGTGNIAVTTSLVDGTGLQSNLTISKSNTSTGGGSVILSGANTYSGGTIVAAGTLLVNGGVAGTSSGTGGGPVNVNGGTLAGSGVITGAVTVGTGAIIQGGTGLYNGATNGSLTLTNTLTLNSGSTVQILIGSNLGHSTLATAGVTFASNQAFNILETATTTTGTYTNIITGLTSDPGTESTWTANGSYGGFVGSFAYDAAGNGIDLIVTTVPEPTTILGGILLIVATGWSQRRRLHTAFAA